MVWLSGRFFSVMWQIPVLCSGSPTCYFLCSTSPLWFYFLSALPLNLSSPQGSRLSENRNSSGAAGSGPWAETEISILPPPPGPECSWDSWSVILHVLPGIWCGWGPWRAPASCHSWGLYKLPQLHFLAWPLQSQAPAASTEACRLQLILYSSERLPADPVNGRQASAGLNQDVKSRWHLRQTLLQKIKIVCVPLFFHQKCIGKHLLCGWCRARLLFFPPYPSGAHSPVGSKHENKDLSLGDQHETRQAYQGSNGERNATLCPEPGKTSHGRYCFTRVLKITEFNE